MTPEIKKEIISKLIKAFLHVFDKNIFLFKKTGVNVHFAIKIK